MVELKQVYKCEVCGNIVEVLFASQGTLVCCGKDMKLMEEKSADSSTEKHVPVIEEVTNGYKVTVGSTLHPMTDEHYIEWIELNLDGVSSKKFLSPGDKPEALFVASKADKISAREYCSIHGLWKN